MFAGSGVPFSVICVVDAMVASRSSGKSSKVCHNVPPTGIGGALPAKGKPARPAGAQRVAVGARTFRPARRYRRPPAGVGEIAVTRISLPSCSFARERSARPTAWPCSGHTARDRQRRCQDVLWQAQRLCAASRCAQWLEGRSFHCSSSRQVRFLESRAETHVVTPPEHVIELVEG